MIKKLIPAIGPLWFIAIIVLMRLGYDDIAITILLIPFLGALYFLSAMMLPIDDIAEKLERRQSD